MGRSGKTPAANATCCPPKETSYLAAAILTGAHEHWSTVSTRATAPGNHPPRVDAEVPGWLAPDVPLQLRSQPLDHGLEPAEIAGQHRHPLELAHGGEARCLWRQGGGLPLASQRSPTGIAEAGSFRMDGLARRTVHGRPSRSESRADGTRRQAGEHAGTVPPQTLPHGVAFSIYARLHRDARGIDPRRFGSRDNAVTANRAQAPAFFACRRPEIR